MSAGVIPYRTGPSGDCEVFLVRRSDSLRFMGGWHAFPGGRLSQRDAAVPVRGAIDGEDAYLSSGKDAAHVACALRELFEEAGILALVGRQPDLAELERVRRLLLDTELDFADWLGNSGLQLDASRLSFAGRWVTPPLSSMRFDATFFLLKWPAEERTQPTVIPGELSDGEWVSARIALDRWDSGDVLLAQPTLETLRVLAENGADGRALLWRSQAHQPNSPHAIEFRPGIRVIPLATRTLPPATHTNALLLGTGDFVLIDPGSPWEVELQRLCEIIDAELNRTGGQLSGIWLSHHHDDHVAGAEALRERYRVPISAHSATVSRLEPKGIRIDGRFEGGESLELAGSRPLRIRVEHVPGHASGHLCFLEERTRTLIGGDMLSGYGTISIDPPDGSMSDYIDSLERLEGLGAQVVLPAHGSMIRDASKALAEARQHRLRREDLVLESWTNGARDPEAMLPAVYGDLDPAIRPFAVRQVLAHLERLELKGDILGLPERIRRQLGRG